MAYPTEQPAGPSQPPEGPEPGVPVAPGPLGSVTDWRQWLRMEGPPRPWRRSLAAGAGAAVAIIVLGVLLGLLWAWLAPAVPVINGGDAGVLVTDPSPEQYIAADGWFTLLGLGFGLIVTVGSWLVLRRDRGPYLLFGVVGGAFVAGRWVAPAVGEWLGRDAYDHWRETAAQGATYLAPPELQSLGPKLVPAFIAAIVLTLLAGWSNDPDLDHPGAHPGYGANYGYPPYTTDPAVPYPPADYAPPAGADRYAPPAGTGPYVPPAGAGPYVPPAGADSYVSPAGARPSSPPVGADSYEPPAGAEPRTPPAGAGEGGAVLETPPREGPAGQGTRLGGDA